MSSAVVVAHPDDESLWCAGAVIREKADVICCTVPRRDPERAIRFFDAVRELGGYPILIPFVESPPDMPIPHLDALDLSKYEKVYTHNAQGEYGHLHHKQIHEHVLETYSGAIRTFNGDDEVIHLTAEESETKNRALACYDHCSPSDGGQTKYEALLKRYRIDMAREGYGIVR